MQQTFEQWMKEVDAAVQALAGCSVNDLADCLFRDWYDDGMSAKAAARKAIRNGSDEDNDE